MKAPGTPITKIFPEVGRETEALGAPSQTEAGAAGNLSPTVMAIAGVEEKLRIAGIRGMAAVERRMVLDARGRARGRAMRNILLCGG